MGKDFNVFLYCRNNLFEGTLGELASYMEEAATKKIDIEAAEFLPNRNAVRYIIPSFRSRIQKFQKELKNLYPTTPLNFNSFDDSLCKLSEGLKLTRSIWKNPLINKEVWEPSLNSQIKQKVEYFNQSLGPNFKSYRIEDGNDKIAWFDFHFPQTISELDKLIFYADWILRSANPYVKRGRPPRPFSVLIFYVVNEFTFFAYDKKGEPIKKGEQIRLKKDWQLIIIALLWLNAVEYIPEVQKFIDDHRDMNANEAIKEFQSLVERYYSNFVRTGKGRGKWGGAFRTEKNVLDFRPGWI